MARKGRPITPKKEQLDHNAVFLNESQTLIVNALEKAPMTFTGLKKEIRLSPSTLAEHLKKLEEKNYIDRSGDHRVIKLSQKALNPVEKTLRGLIATVQPPCELDVGLGRKLLAGPVIEIILELDGCIPWVAWRSLEEQKKLLKMVEEELAKRGFPPPRSPPNELDEIKLIRVLAAYELERNPDSLIAGITKDDVSRVAHRFFVLPYVKEKGLTKEFDGLLKWIIPLRFQSKPINTLFVLEIERHFLSLLLEEYRAPQTEKVKAKEKEGGEK
jgi:DNA-binding Lrp family transcriptional regulator